MKCLFTAYLKTVITSSLAPEVLTKVLIFGLFSLHLNAKLYSNYLSLFTNVFGNLFAQSNNILLAFFISFSIYSSLNLILSLKK